MLRRLASTGLPCLLLVGIAVALRWHRLAFHGAFVNNDFTIHYNWLREFSALVQAGDPYPHWMPLANSGLGEPALLYYSPLFYWVGTFFHWLTGSAWTALCLTEATSVAVTGCAAFLMLKRELGGIVAFVVGVALQLCPMTLLLFDYFNGWPWAMSFTFAVLSMLAAARIDDRRVTISVPLALAFAFVCVTHLVSGLMVLCSIWAVAVGHLWLRRSFAAAGRVLASVGLSTGLGLAIAGAYFVPAVMSLGYVNPDVWRDTYIPHNAFIFPTFSYLLYGMRWSVFQWIAPGVAALLLIACAFHVVRARRADRALAPGAATPSSSWLPAASLTAVGAVAMILASELTFPIWMVDTPLRKVEFPHRFVYVAFAALILAAGYSLRGALDRRATAPLVLAGLALALSMTLGAVAVTKFALVDAKRFAPDEHPLQPHYGLAEYQLKGVGPEWSRYVDDGGFEGECARLGVTGTAGSPLDPERTWTVETGKAQHLRLPLFWFPSWSATINGRFVAATRDPATSLVAVDLPPGRSRILVRWSRLPQEVVGVGLSIAGLVALVVLALRRRAGRGANSAG